MAKNQGKKTLHSSAKKYPYETLTDPKTGKPFVNPKTGKPIKVKVMTD